MSQRRNGGQEGAWRSKVGCTMLSWKRDAMFLRRAANGVMIVFECQIPGTLEMIGNGDRPPNQGGQVLFPALR